MPDYFYFCFRFFLNLYLPGETLLHQQRDFKPMPYMQVTESCELERLYHIFTAD